MTIKRIKNEISTLYNWLLKFVHYLKAC